MPWRSYEKIYVICCFADTLAFMCDCFFSVVECCIHICFPMIKRVGQHAIVCVPIKSAFGSSWMRFRFATLFFHLFFVHIWTRNPNKCCLHINHCSTCRRAMSTNDDVELATCVSNFIDFFLFLFQMISSDLYVVQSEQIFSVFSLCHWFLWWKFSFFRVFSGMFLCVCHFSLCKDIDTGSSIIKYASRYQHRS